ncbi:MAG: hypothetical protein KatS3mg008_0480 [Acidimicrobiales bacterium]|nr:MAG: hypothetical protein KatS3mg008_0480 [Acidimicrobiales bacterium]
MVDEFETGETTNMKTRDEQSYSTTGEDRTMTVVDRQKVARKAAGALMAAIALLTAACAQDSGRREGADESTTTQTYRVLRVGKGRQYKTIQAAVDAAKEGDLVLIDRGVYHESVIVQTENIVIRGVDRNEVILDGKFELDNGITVFANGVAVENLTARNYKVNGVFFTGDYDEGFTLTGYRISYVTALNNGDYGIYAFNATRGQIDHSYASGSPDAGFYIGQCNPCNALVWKVTAEANQIGYSGTNSSDVVIAESVWRRNRLGIVPNSQDGEKLPPVQRNTIVGNLVIDNDNPKTPEKNSDYRVGTGTGIVLTGAVETVVERNTVVENDRAGIVVIPWLFSGTQWQAKDNVVRDNFVRGARTAADLVLGLTDSSRGPLGNCFAANDFETSIPDDIEKVAPCEGQAATGFDTLEKHLSAFTPGPEPIDYKDVPAPPLEFENMPDAETAPPRPAVDVPIRLDLKAIKAPRPPRD